MNFSHKLIILVLVLGHLSACCLATDIVWHTCREQMTMCLDSLANCNSRCWDDPHCQDRTDTRSCDPIDCFLLNFECVHDGNCISRRKVCDGRRDCYSGSDEWNCPTSSTPSAIVTTQKPSTSTSKIYPEVSTPPSPISEGPSTFATPISKEDSTSATRISKEPSTSATLISNEPSISATLISKELSTLATRISKEPSISDTLIPIEPSTSTTLMSKKPSTSGSTIRQESSNPSFQIPQNTSTSTNTTLPETAMSIDTIIPETSILTSAILRERTCPDNYCMQDADCIAFPDKYHCNCPPSFIGKRCEIQLGFGQGAHKTILVMGIALPSVLLCLALTSVLIYLKKRSPRHSNIIGSNAESQLTLVFHAKE